MHSNRSHGKERFQTQMLHHDYFSEGPTTPVRNEIVPGHNLVVWLLFLHQRTQERPIWQRTLWEVFIAIARHETRRIPPIWEVPFQSTCIIIPSAEKCIQWSERSTPAYGDVHRSPPCFKWLTSYISRYSANTGDRTRTI